jgi:hypothetical protein
MEEAYETETILDDYKVEVPVIPTTTFFNYQHFVRHWMGWSYFRNSYTKYNLAKTLKYFFADIENWIRRCRGSQTLSATSKRGNGKICRLIYLVYPDIIIVCPSSYKNTQV